MSYTGGVGRGLLRQKLAAYMKKQVMKCQMENTKSTLDEKSHRFESLQKKTTDQSDEILFQDAVNQDQNHEKCSYKSTDVTANDKPSEVTKQLDVSNSRCNENKISRNTKTISGESTFVNKQIEVEMHLSKNPTDVEMGQSNEDISQNVDGNKDKNYSSCNDKAHADLEEEYHELTKKMDAFQIDDDGIKFNIKLRNLLDYFKEKSESPAKFDEVFQSLYKPCLRSRKLIPKFIRVITSRSVQKIEIQGRKFLPQFLKLLQQDFEQCEVLQKKNLDAFHNFIALMGEFLAVKSDFEPVKESLLVVLEMLLLTAEPKDVVLFLEQIFVNYNNLRLKSSSPLMLQVRKTLIEKKNLSSESRTRLMLALDLVMNPASLKNVDVMNLYKEILGVD